MRFAEKQNFNKSVLNEFKRLKYDNDALSREEEIRKIFDRQVKERIQFSDDISSHISSSITQEILKRSLLMEMLVFMSLYLTKNKFHTSKQDVLLEMVFLEKGTGLKYICHTPRDLEIM